jgi:hypothetical protein
MMNTLLAGQPRGGGLVMGRVKKLFSEPFRRTLEPIQPPIKSVPVAPSLGIKRPFREVDHTSPFSAELKDEGELCVHATIRLHVAHKDNFVFTTSTTQGNFELSTSEHR